MSATASSVSIQEVNPMLLLMASGNIVTDLANISYNVTGNVTANTSQEIEDSVAGYESYTLYKLTYYMADYYLWIVLAFGVPGNLASIFTILSMTTVSSSKVNTFVMHHRNTTVGQLTNDKHHYNKEVGSTNEILRTKSENISTNINSRCKKTVLTPVVGRRRSVQTVATVNAHVAILALTDTVAIIVKVTYWQASGHFIQLTAIGCTLIMFVQQFSTVYANWVVVAMTAERFLAVWFPLRVGQMYTRRKAIIMLACLAAMTASVYLFFFWSFTENYEEGYGYWCEMRQEYILFVNESFYWIDGIYYAILPCSLILIGNTLIITNIKRAMTIQRHLTNAFDQGGRKARDQRQITVMLVVVSVIFLLLNMPSAILYIIKPYWTYKKPSYEHVKYMFTIRFLHVLADANHAVNFYLYFLSMSSFRRRFMDSIRCRKNTYTRPAASSVSRTSQTFLHSARHSGDQSRRRTNGMYTAYKRSGNYIESKQSVETYKNNSNGTIYGHKIQDSRQGLSAISAV